MSFEITKERLISYLYDELSQGEREQMKSQIAESPDSQEFLRNARDTQQTLKEWQDEDPHLDLAFTQKSVPFPQSSIPGILKRRRRLFAGLTVGLLAATLVLAFLNLEASYSQGTFELRISLQSDTLQQPNPDSPVTHVTLQDLAKDREKSEERFLNLLRASELRQQEKFDQALLQVIHDLDSRRQQDLRAMGKTLEDVDLTSEVRFRQTDALLQELFRIKNPKPLRVVPNRQILQTRP